jgi:hypothetical protein
LKPDEVVVVELVGDLVVGEPGIRASVELVEVGATAVGAEVPPLHAPATTSRDINHKLRGRIRESYCQWETAAQLERPMRMP